MKVLTGTWRVSKRLSDILSPQALKLLRSGLSFHCCLVKRLEASRWILYGKSNAFLSVVSTRAVHFCGPLSASIHACYFCRVMMFTKSNAFLSKPEGYFQFCRVCSTFILSFPGKKPSAVHSGMFGSSQTHV